MAPGGSRRGAMAAALAVLIAAAPAGAQTPIAGGGSFNDAPVLEPGAYADTLRGGEQLFYAVELEAGQRVAATVEIEGRSTTSHFMAVALYTALRAEAGEDTQSFGPQDRRVSLRAESEPAEQPGLHYVSVAAREAGEAEDPEQFDTRLDLAVTGEAATPTATPSPSATATPTAEPRGGDEDGLPAGAIALGLAVGLVAGFAGRRALGR